MILNQEQNIPDFAREAVTRFESIMAGAHKEQLGEINRGNRGELFVLRYLYFEGQEVTPSRLSQAMKSSTARVSALLRTLEEKGQIERRTGKGDRRNVLVTITDSGRDRVRKEIGQMRRNLGTVFSAMGEQNTADFLRLSSLFSDLMKKHAVCKEG